MSRLRGRHVSPSVPRATAGKMAFRRRPYDGGSGRGNPHASKGSVGQPGSALAWDESWACADRDACRPFFRTDVAACPHRAEGLTCLPRSCDGAGEATAKRVARRRHVGSAARCGQRDQRQSRNRAAGVPIRVRRDSPRTERQTRRPTLISARRAPHPSERGHREAGAGGAVSPRPAEAPQSRRAFGASDPLMKDQSPPTPSSQFLVSGS
jgi:hypothetical protein